MEFDEQGSPIPELSDEEIRRHVVATRRDVADIKVALVGNNLGTSGVIPRLTVVERKVETQDKKLNNWTAILLAVGAVLVFAKDLIPLFLRK